MNSDKEAEDTEWMEDVVEVEEVYAEVLGGVEVGSNVVDETMTSSIPAQTLQVENTVESPSLLCKDCNKTFSTTDSLLVHAQTKHWVLCSSRQHCPLKGCSYVAMKGGMRKMTSHMKEKHAPLARNFGNYDVQRQDWLSS